MQDLISSMSIQSPNDCDDTTENISQIVVTLDGQ